MDRIGEIEQRLKAATPWPWSIGCGVSVRSAWAIEDLSGNRLINLDISANVDSDGKTGQVEEDLELISHAPSDLAYLLARVKALEGLVEKKDVAMRRIGKAYHPHYKCLAPSKCCPKNRLCVPCIAADSIALRVEEPKP